MYPNIERKETGPACMDKTAGCSITIDKATQFAVQQVLGADADLTVRTFSEFVACLDAEQAIHLAVLLSAKTPEAIASARNKLVDAYLADPLTQREIDDKVESYLKDE